MQSDTISRKLSIAKEVLNNLNLVWPVWFTLVCRKSIDIVPVIFVGRLGAKYLSASGLATVTANVTGYSMLIGLSGGLSTILSQAYGAKDFELFNVTVQRGGLILLATCVPISITWYYSNDILLALGQDEDLANKTRHYLCLLLPGIWSNAVSLTIMNYFYAMKHTREVAVISILMAALHPLWLYLYIFQFDIGYSGAALAISTSRFLELLGLLGMLSCSSLLQYTKFQLKSDSFSGWGPLLKLGLPNLLMMTEWWASEIIIFLSGFMSDPVVSISAMSIYQNTNSLCYMLPIGFQITGSIRVGNELGKNHPKLARLAAWTSTTMAVIISCVCGLVLYLQRDVWGYIFTDDISVVEATSKLLPILAIYVIADGTQGALTGSIKGIGKQNLGGPVVLFSYYVIAIPISWYLGFKLHLDLFGLCIGTTVGTIVHAILYGAIVALIDWEKEAVKASGGNPQSEAVPPFSFYSIAKSQEEGVVLNNSSSSSSSSSNSDRSIFKHVHNDDNNTASSNCSSNFNRDDNANSSMDIFRWKKIKERKNYGILSNVYKIFGYKPTVVETRYELVPACREEGPETTGSQNSTINSFEYSSAVDINDDFDNDDDSDSDGRDDDGIDEEETIVVFRRNVK